jgi:hypothetical protein
MISNSHNDEVFSSNIATSRRHPLSAVDAVSGTRSMDPRFHADAEGVDNVEGITSNDPDYVGANYGLRSRSGGNPAGRGRNDNDSEFRNAKQHNVNLYGSRIKAGGPAAPELYLNPVRRESICDLIMKFFKFR